jgi:hypothetical protein
LPNAALIRITLLDLDPAPWREILVPLSMSLKGLHDVIQASFLWHDAHLWEFEIEDRRFGPEADSFMGERTYKAANLKLTRLRDGAITDFLYTYDMGDHWGHRVQILETCDADAPLPRFVAGKWRCPPEDVGGFPGFADFLDALADPRHPEHRHLLDWYGGPFDPGNIDEPAIQARMARLTRTRGRRTPSR